MAKSGNTRIIHPLALQTLRTLQAMLLRLRTRCLIQLKCTLYILYCTVWPNRPGCLPTSALAPVGPVGRKQPSTRGLVFPLPWNEGLSTREALFEHSKEKTTPLEKFTLQLSSFSETSEWRREENKISFILRHQHPHVFAFPMPIFWWMCESFYWNVFPFKSGL